jgi:CheY-like chemotaxis protein
VLQLARSFTRGRFTAGDGDALAELCSQIPVTLMLARTLLLRGKQRLSIPPPSSRVRGRRKRVLLVDDDRLARDSLRGMLQQLGCIAVCVGSAREALQVLEDQRHSFDLMITDVVMPETNGLELARAAARLQSTLPVLFVSGYTSGVCMEREDAGERLDFLQKPLTLAALAERMERVLGRLDRAQDRKSQ